MIQHRNDQERARWASPTMEAVRAKKVGCAAEDGAQPIDEAACDAQAPAADIGFYGSFVGTENGLLASTTNMMSAVSSVVPLLKTSIGVSAA